MTRGMIKLSKMAYELELLESENFPEKNKQAIKTFVEDLLLEGISEIRRTNYVQRLRLVSRWIPDVFLNPSREDIKKVVLILSGDHEQIYRKRLKNGIVQEHSVKKPYAENTKATYLDMMKKFYRRTLGEEKVRELFKGINVDKKRINHVSKSDLIQPEEYRKMVDATLNARDKALIATLYDSGCRIGELLLMKIRNATFDEYGGVLEVPWDGKTGFRNVRVVGDSIPYLRSWMDNHPDRNNMESYLFCGLKTAEKMDYWEVYRVIQRVNKRAGIKKKIHPHLFRHTRATILASKLATAPFESLMGWTPGTKQVGTYVHMSGKQTDLAVLNAYGVEVKDEGIDEAKPIGCPRCEALNASDAKYCRKCWMPLDVKIAMEQKQKEKRAVSILEKMELDPVEQKFLGVIKRRPQLMEDMLLEIFRSLKDKGEF